MACGMLFGVGLAISDMINPARVLAFLDVAGRWDPALAWVMGGALLVSATAYRLQRCLPAPLLGDVFHVPPRGRIDARLLTGAGLFGTGWGLVGLCPGPAVAALVTLQPPILVFVAAMLAGMALHRWQASA
ncbi:MAG TPA: YeeE/YedE family protein [Stenotrophomonas sp.]